MRVIASASKIFDLRDVLPLCKSEPGLQCMAPELPVCHRKGKVANSFRKQGKSKRP